MSDFNGGRKRKQAVTASFFESVEIIVPGLTSLSRSDAESFLQVKVKKLEMKFYKFIEL